MTSSKFEFDGLVLPASFTERYEPLEELGRGGLGIVLLAKDKNCDSLVAAKFLTVSFSNNEDVRRFAREARLAFELDHPNIVKGLDLGGAIENIPYVVFEYVKGGTLYEAMKKGKFKKTERAIEVLSGIGRGLSFAHKKGILHRDLKPANILLTKDGRPKIADFGLALVQAEKERLTRTGLLMGTPTYMAPEQIEGSEIGAPADIYALAEITYELLSGQKAFSGNDMGTLFEQKLKGTLKRLSTVSVSLPSSLCKAVERGLNRDPKRRPKSVEEFVKSLRMANKKSKAVVLEQTIKGPSKNLAEVEVKKVRRPYVYLAVIPIALALLVTFSSFLGNKEMPHIKVSDFKIEVGADRANLSFATNRAVKSKVEIVNDKGETVAVHTVSDRPLTRHHNEIENLTRGMKQGFYLSCDGRRVGLRRYLTTKKAKVILSGVAATEIGFTLKWAKGCRCKVEAELRKDEKLFAQEFAISSNEWPLHIGPIPSKKSVQGSVRIFDGKRLIVEKFFKEKTTAPKESVLLAALHPSAKSSKSIFESITEGATSRAFSCPAVYGDKVFYVTERLGMVGFSLTKNKIVWQRGKTFGRVKTLRLYGNHLVALDSDEKDACNLFCLDAELGTDKWSDELVKGTYGRELLVTKTGAISIAPRKGLYCHAWDGRSAWKLEQALTLPYELGENGRLWVSGQSCLVCVQVTDGRVLSSIDLPAQINSRCRPIDLGDEIVLFLKDQTMVICSIKDEKLLRQHKLRFLMDYAKHINGQIIGISENAPYLLTAIDLKTGKTIWEQSLQSVNGLNGLPSFTKNRIYCIAHKNCVLSYDAISGRLLWKSVDLAHATGRTIVRPNGVLYVTVDLRLKHVIDRL